MTQIYSKHIILSIYRERLVEKKILRTERLNRTELANTVRQVVSLYAFRKTMWRHTQCERSRCADDNKPTACKQQCTIRRKKQTLEFYALLCMPGRLVAIHAITLERPRRRCFSCRHVIPRETRSFGKIRNSTKENIEHDYSLQLS